MGKGKKTKVNEGVKDPLSSKNRKGKNQGGKKGCLPGSGFCILHFFFFHGLSL